MFLLWAIASIWHVSLTCAAHHQHHHRALAQPSTVTTTETSGISVAIPTDPGSSVPIDIGFGIPTNPGSSIPIDIGIDGYATSKASLEHDTDSDSPMGIIEIGSPGQTIDVQFDTTFNGVLVRSTRENLADTDGILLYNSSESNSWGYIYNSIAENTYSQTLKDDSYAVAFAGRETFNIGGTLYSNIPFGQLQQYYPNSSGQAVPFGGTSGIIGLNYNSSQQPLFPSFMYAISDQLIGTSQIKAFKTIINVTSRMEMLP
jgi:hypothetical protein